MIPNTIASSTRRGADMVKQVLSFINEGAVISKSGKKFPTRIHTFCCHGDEATGVGVVGAVREALEKNGIRLVPLPEMDF